MKSRRCARINAGMTNGCYRRQVVDEAVVIAVTLADEPAEATFAELVKIARQIIPAHLINDDSYHELRLLTKLWTYICLCRQVNGATQ